MSRLRRKSSIPLSFFTVLFTTFVVFVGIFALFYRSFDSRSQAASGLACNAVCGKDSDCSTGYCYQPPMPRCIGGDSCLQVMPKKICRTRTCSGDDTCTCPVALPKKVTTTTFSADSSSAPISWQHASSGTNRLLVVAFSYRSAGGSMLNAVRQVTYGSTSPIQLTKIRRDIGGDYATELWYGVNPPTGTHMISTQFSGTADSIVASATTYEGVGTADPIRVHPVSKKIEGVGANSTTIVRGAKGISLQIPTSQSELIVGVVSTYTGSANKVTSDPLQTQTYNLSRKNVIGVGAMKTPEFSTEQFSWTPSVSWPWSVSAISIQPYRNVAATPTPTPAPTASPMTVKVFGVGYNPSQNGVGLAEKYYQSNMGFLNPSQMEDSIFSKTKDAFTALSNGQINYTVVGKTRVSTFQPYTDGFSYTLNSFARCVLGRPEYNPTACDNQKLLFDYDKWYADNQICEKAEAAGADEIWVIVPPYIMAWENIMVGPTAGFDINGPYKIYPKCKKHMAVIHGTYERDSDMLHVIGHRFEATMRYLTATWTVSDRERYWERFAALKLYDGITPSSPYCGNAHFSSNSSEHYDYENTSNTAVSTCGDFRNFPNYTGQTTSGNCSLWGCNELGWQTYWMGNVPRSSGSVNMTSSAGKAFTFPKNWWTLWLNPGEAIAQRARM